MKRSLLIFFTFIFFCGKAQERLSVAFKAESLLTRGESNSSIAHLSKSIGIRLSGIYEFNEFLDVQASIGIGRSGGMNNDLEWRTQHLSSELIFQYNILPFIIVAPDNIRFNLDFGLGYSYAITNGDISTPLTDVNSAFQTYDTRYTESINWGASMEYAEFIENWSILFGLRTNNFLFDDMMDSVKSPRSGKDRLQRLFLGLRLYL